MNAKQIGTRIRDLRYECGLTQEALAEEVSLSVSYLSCIERGKKRASLAALVQIAFVLQTTVDYLIREEKEYDLCGNQIYMRFCSKSEIDSPRNLF